MTSPTRLPTHLQDNIPFTQFHNYLLQAYSDHKFTLRQLTVLCQLVRRLLGFHKTEDVISASQVAAWTGLDASNAARALRELTSLKVIEREKVSNITGGLGHSYNVRLVADVGRWLVPYRRSTPLGKNEAGDDYLTLVKDGQEAGHEAAHKTAQETVQQTAQQTAQDAAQEAAWAAPATQPSPRVKLAHQAVQQPQHSSPDEAMGFRYRDAGQDAMTDEAATHAWHSSDGGFPPREAVDHSHSHLFAHEQQQWQRTQAEDDEHELSDEALAALLAGDARAEEGGIEY